MRFHIEHLTEYTYSEPATESFSELRLRPRESLRQDVSHHSTHIDPAVPVESYTDYFGNYVESISIPFRHERLGITSICEVETDPHLDALSGLDLSLAEARSLYGPRRRELYQFLRPSQYIPFHPELGRLARELLAPSTNFTEAIKGLNSHIFNNYKYQPGVTDIQTPLLEVVAEKQGVCQDFAHLMICLCRHAGIPARYISGYIESHIEPPVERPAETQTKAPASDKPLIGSAASHAWVEVYTPNHFWVGLDPTNNIMEDERHVQIGIGRDYHDVPPLQGVFKGRQRQSLTVQVRVLRTNVRSQLENSGI